MSKSSCWDHVWISLDIFENDHRQLTQHKRYWDELCVAVAVYRQLLKQPLLVIIQHKPNEENISTQMLEWLSPKDSEGRSKIIVKRSTRLMALWWSPHPSLAAGGGLIFLMWVMFLDSVDLDSLMVFELLSGPSPGNILHQKALWRTPRVTMSTSIDSWVVIIYWSRCFFGFGVSIMKQNESKLNQTSSCEGPLNRYQTALSTFSFVNSHWDQFGFDHIAYNTLVETQKGKLLRIVNLNFRQNNKYYFQISAILRYVCATETHYDSDQWSKVVLSVREYL